MNFQNTTVEKGPGASKRRGAGPYFLMVSVQTAGVAILLANMLPIYRLMAVDFAKYKPDSRPLWALAGVFLIQVSYWILVRLRPPLPRTDNILLSHIVSFAARLVFVCVTASFTVMFLNRFEELKDMDYPPLRALAVLVMFFSIFCWTTELERLAKAFQGNSDEPDEAHRD